MTLLGRWERPPHGIEEWLGACWARTGRLSHCNCSNHLTRTRQKPISRTKENHDLCRVTLGFKYCVFSIFLHVAASLFSLSRVSFCPNMFLVFLLMFVLNGGTETGTVRDPRVLLTSFPDTLLCPVLFVLSVSCDSPVRPLPLAQVKTTVRVSPIMVAERHTRNNSRGVHGWISCSAIALVSSTTLQGPVLPTRCRQKWITWTRSLRTRGVRRGGMKCMVLCMRYTANVAVAVAPPLLACSCPSAPLPTCSLSAERYPRYPPPWCPSSAQFSPCATVVVPVVFLVVLHRCHELLSNSSPVMVDKLCTHQRDDEKKLEGVAHLGLTLFFSSVMVVLDSDVCFNRLWTVHEMASCLVVHVDTPSWSCR